MAAPIYTPARGVWGFCACGFILGKVASHGVLVAMQEAPYRRPDGALWAVQMRWVGWKEGDISRDILEAEPPRVEHPQERSQKKSRHIQFHLRQVQRQAKQMMLVLASCGCCTVTTDFMA